MPVRYQRMVRQGKIAQGRVVADDGQSAHRQGIGQFGRHLGDGDGAVRVLSLPPRRIRTVDY